MAEFFLSVTAGGSEQREALVGDAAERFGCDCQRFGRRRAVLLYWSDIVRSLLPLLWRRIRQLTVLSLIARLFG